MKKMLVVILSLMSIASGCSSDNISHPEIVDTNKKTIIITKPVDDCINDIVEESKHHDLIEDKDVIEKYLEK